MSSLHWFSFNQLHILNYPFFKLPNEACVWSCKQWAKIIQFQAISIIILSRVCFLQIFFIVLSGVLKGSHFILSSGLDSCGELHIILFYQWDWKKTKQEVQWRISEFSKNNLFCNSTIFRPQGSAPVIITQLVVSSVIKGTA